MPMPWSAGLTKDTDERLRSASERQKGKPRSEETKRKLRAAGLRYYKQTPGSRERVREAVNRVYRERPEVKEKMRQAKLDLLARDPDALKRMLGFRASPEYFTGIERLFADALDRQGILYQHNLRIGRYLVDFLFFDNVIVECDGHRWHISEEKRARDAERDRYLQERGYLVFRLDEESLIEDADRRLAVILEVLALPEPETKEGRMRLLSNISELRKLLTWFSKEGKNGQSQIEQSLEALRAGLIKGKTVFVAANGGSAAEAAHFSAELVSLGFRCMNLAADSSVLTALANDISYEEVFAQQLVALSEPEDVLLALSTSGNSKNILRVLRMAEACGIRRVVLTGSPGGQSVALADHLVRVPSNQTQRIQEIHLMILHYWFEKLKEYRCDCIGKGIP